MSGTEEYYQELIRATYVTAMMSSDPSTQNGAFLVGFSKTRSVNEPTFGYEFNREDWKDREGKLTRVEHAERNAIFAAARLGIRTQGLTMAASWAACSDCARAIVQAGISCLVRHIRPVHKGWEDSIAIGNQILDIGGVNVIDVKGSIPYAVSVRHGGKIYDPSKDEYLVY